MGKLSSLKSVPGAQKVGGHCIKLSSYKVLYITWRSFALWVSANWVKGKKRVIMAFLVIDAAAAKSLQSCPTLCDPMDGSPLGSPSLGFSRREHWSGLPFPSPMHESEKWKWRCSVVSDSSRPHGLQPTRPLCPWDFPGKGTGVGCHCLLQVIDAWCHNYISIKEKVMLIT